MGVKESLTGKASDAFLDGLTINGYDYVEAVSFAKQVFGKDEDLSRRCDAYLQELLRED